MPILPKNEIDALKMKYYYSYVVSRFSREAQARRLLKTRELFKTKLLIGDLHTHSTYSDGIGTIMENWEMALSAGFDFLFATDHYTIAQKRLCRPKGLWWGQEPNIGGHHLCVLSGKKKFTPKKDNPNADLKRALKIAPFAFFPHPAGWFPKTWYPEERIRQLDNIEGPFAIEVINGANKLDRAYDEFDEAAIRAWDRLLSMGRKITALGGSDAHLPQAIGCIWTGVFGASLNRNSVIKALKAGHCFASEAPLVMFTCGNRMMGDLVTLQKGGKVMLKGIVADAAGLHSVRIISQGRVIKSFMAGGKPLLKIQYCALPGKGSLYYRLECTAIDDRRAFSTPIYIKVQ